MTIDLKIYKTKKELLTYFQSQFNEMYGCNYDALIDVLTFVKEDIEIIFKNSSVFEDFKNLQEVFQIIQEENSHIKVEFKDE